MILTSRIAAASLLLFLLLFVSLAPFPEAQAGERTIERSSFVQTYVTAGGLGGFLIIVIALALIVLIPVGATKANRENAWPHWRRLVRGLGEAAFLFGIISAFSGMVNAFQTVAEMGASVTPADLADGLSRAIAPIYMGAMIALLALLGSGLIRAVSPVARPSG